ARGKGARPRSRGYVRHPGPCQTAAGADRGRSARRDEGRRRRENPPAMHVSTAIALVLALVSTTLTNLAYLRQHDAAAQLPALSRRRPVQSARILTSDRSWMLGFAMETSGFLLYAAALALASLALVQSVVAGGIGVLAFASARFSGNRLSRRELSGALLSIV